MRNTNTDIKNPIARVFLENFNYLNRKTGRRATYFPKIFSFFCNTNLTNKLRKIACGLMQEIEQINNQFTPDNTIQLINYIQSALHQATQARIDAFSKNSVHYIANLVPNDMTTEMPFFYDEVVPGKFENEIENSLIAIEKYMRSNQCDIDSKSTKIIYKAIVFSLNMTQRPYIYYRMMRKNPDAQEMLAF